MKEIRSLTNPRLKYARSLHRRRYREQEGKCLVEGVRLLEDAVAAGVEIEAVFYTDRLLARERGRQLLQECQGRGSSCYRLPEAVLASLAETESPQGVVAVVKYPQWERETLLVGPGLLLLVDRIQDPGNLGTMPGTAEAAGCRGAILSPALWIPIIPRCSGPVWGRCFASPSSPGKPFPPSWKNCKKGATSWWPPTSGECPLLGGRSRLPGALVVGNEAWARGRKFWPRLRNGSASP